MLPSHLDAGISKLTALSWMGRLVVKRLLLATTALALGGHIFGDDALAAPYNWTGCYVGANAGAGWNRNRISEPLNSGGQNFAPVGSSFDVNGNGGFIGGGQFGCNYQFDTNWMAGLQGDMSFGSISGQATDPFFGGKSGGPLTLQARTTWLASVQGRAGYAWNNVLLFGTGGPAWAHTKYDGGNLEDFGNPSLLCFNGVFTACNPTGSDTRLGWTLGAGFEWAFNNNWTVSFVYNHYDFGSHSVTLTDAVNSSTPASIDVKTQIDTAKVSLNYRFRAGTP
ncbi:MAG TPA: outer membrane beta-barrel protein [Pseudolabrys sp.]